MLLTLCGLTSVKCVLTELNEILWVGIMMRCFSVAVEFPYSNGLATDEFKRLQIHTFIGLMCVESH